MRRSRRFITFFVIITGLALLIGQVAVADDGAEAVDQAVSSFEERLTDAPPPQSEDARVSETMTLLGGLLAGLALLTVAALLRAFRPKPMEHKGPSSTVDHWQEAGRRFKLK